MIGAVGHIKSVTIADFTGTVTVFNSAGTTTTVNATDIVRPSDWDSIHSFNMSISGNTLGSSSIGNATAIVLAGGTNITLSMNTAASAATVSIQADGGILSRKTDWGVQVASSNSQFTQSGITLSSASFRAFNLQEALSFSRVDFPVSINAPSTTTSNTAAFVISSGLVIYTRSGSTLSPVVGAFGTTTYSYASGTSNWSGLTGGKLVSFPIATKLEPGEYYAGFQLSTATSSVGAATTNLGLTVSMYFNASYSAVSFFDVGSTASASTNIVFQGLYSTTITATNQTIAMSNITVTGSPGVRANIPLMFRNW